MLKVGILSFAHMHAYSYASCLQQLEGVQIAGIADQDEQRGEEAARRFDTRYFSDPSTLLKEDIQAVVVCSENAHHKQMAVEAAEAGKHILCEKPIATTLEDGQAIVAACQKNGVKLQMAFPCRFHPAVAKAKQMLEQKAIGQVLAINCTNRGRMPGGWFVDRKLAGGGAVMDHTVHVVDLLRWMFKTEVARVYAEIDTRFHPLEVDDCGILSLTLQNGIFATLDASWSRPVNSFPTWGDVTMEFTGTQGILTLNTFAQNLSLYSEKQGKVQWINWGGNMDLGLIKDWVDAVATEKAPSVSGEDGLKALEVALAAYESAAGKRVVQL